MDAVDSDDFRSSGRNPGSVDDASGDRRGLDEFANSEEDLDVEEEQEETHESERDEHLALAPGAKGGRDGDDPREEREAGWAMPGSIQALPQMVSDALHRQQRQQQQQQPKEQQLTGIDPDSFQLTREFLTDLPADAIHYDLQMSSGPPAVALLDEWAPAVPASRSDRTGEDVRTAGTRKTTTTINPDPFLSSPPDGGGLEGSAEELLVILAPSAEEKGVGQEGLQQEETSRLNLNLQLQQE
ncbi:uncharacterized protein LOC133357023 [Lethenteron reissneri]|uniref:uncharacterized protein LOC133357023 n=1 Tax=Lethenteron reissneri TaxID=7753 RepID=UPI002AB685BE|nr:uncharacterized protein LOC133357023 [Lethenteron reissneri]